LVCMLDSDGFGRPFRLGVALLKYSGGNLLLRLVRFV
jgi:hypothetical protein